MNIFYNLIKLARERKNKPKDKVVGNLPPLN